MKESALLHAQALLAEWGNQPCPRCQNTTFIADAGFTTWNNQELWIPLVACSACGYEVKGGEGRLDESMLE